MVTATCETKDCTQYEIEEFVCGDPSPIYCGGCGNPCELSEPYPDPPEPPMFPA